LSILKETFLIWIIHKPTRSAQHEGGGKAVAHEAVVNYREWATTKLMW
jgi:hypothetical protein